MIYAEQGVVISGGTDQRSCGAQTVPPEFSSPVESSIPAALPNTAARAEENDAAGPPIEERITQDETVSRSTSTMLQPETSSLEDGTAEDELLEELGLFDPSGIETVLSDVEQLRNELATWERPERDEVWGDGGATQPTNCESFDTSSEILGRPLTSEVWEKGGHEVRYSLRTLQPDEIVPLALALETLPGECPVSYTHLTLPTILLV